MALATTRKSARGVGFSLASGITFDDLAAFAGWLGSGQEFRVAAMRLAKLEELEERLLGMAPTWEEIAALPDPDFLSFMELVRWRRDNPGDRPPVRALVIRGLDTKWIERNKAVVREAFRLLGCFDPDAESDIERMGFDTRDRMTVWFRCGPGIGGIADHAPARPAPERNPRRAVSGCSPRHRHREPDLLRVA